MELKPEAQAKDYVEDPSLAIQAFMAYGKCGLVTPGAARGNFGESHVDAFLEPSMDGLFFPRSFSWQWRSWGKAKKKPLEWRSLLADVALRDSRGNSLIETETEE